MAELASLVQRLEVAVSRLEAVSGAGVASAGSGAGAVFVEAYNSLLSGPVEEYLSLSQQIGGDVQKQAEMMKRVFSCQKQFLITASSSQKPSDAVLSTLLAPLSSVIQQVQSFREQNRSSTFFNHLSAVSESVPALGWVAIAPKPGPYVKEMQDAAMFYTNRVLKDYKEKDKKHVDWVKSYLSIWTELQNYIKQHHTTGLCWSKTGPVASGSSAAPARSAGGAPPPPPGPPPPQVDLDQSPAAGDSGATSRNALFASINKGSDITKGLKHVSDDQKTHKNPVMGKVPTISINKTDGCHVYLSAASLDCEIVSAKSSEMNVLVPGAGGDFTELPVPEQFKTVWDGKKLVTTATEIAG
uniref:Adenylyl cyclase-associated protein n=1 Tax=Scleropages formosus TaxID=113540 RepID=A0A8C9VEQ7_SCLFO